MAQHFHHHGQRSQNEYESGNPNRYGSSFAASSRLEGSAAFTSPPEYLGTPRDAPREQIAPDGSHPGWQAPLDLGPQYSVAWDNRGGAHFSAGRPVTDGIHPISPELGPAPQQYAHTSGRLGLPAAQPVERDAYNRQIIYGHEAPQPAQSTSPYTLVSPPLSGAGAVRHAAEHFAQAPSGMITHVTSPVWHHGHKGPVSLHTPFAASSAPGATYGQPGMTGGPPPQPHPNYSWYPRSHASARERQGHPSPLPHAPAASQIGSETWARQYGAVPEERPRFASSEVAMATQRTAHASTLPFHRSQNAPPPMGNEQHLPTAPGAMHMANALARGAGSVADDAFANTSEQSVGGLPLSFQVMVPDSPHPEYYALERIPAVPATQTQQYVHSHSGGSITSPIASEAPPAAPREHHAGSASSHPGESPDPLAAFLHHGQAYGDDRSFSNSPNGSPWLPGSSYGSDLATMVSGLNSSIASSASGSPGAAPEFRHEPQVMDGSRVLASVLASGGSLASDPRHTYHEQSFVPQGQEADAHVVGLSSELPVTENADTSTAGGTKGRGTRNQKKADKQTTSLKKEVRLEEGRCETCSVVFADIYLRGVVDDFKPPFKLRYICIACHGADSREPTLAGSLAKKRTRALDPMTSAVCRCCRKPGQHLHGRC